MGRAFLAGLVLAVLATCPACVTEDNSQICDQGIAKVDACGGQAEVSGDVDCTGQVQCIFTCVNDATCEEITAPAGTNYEACQDACGQQ